MSFLETPRSPPQSPKRLCEINYTTIAEDAENLQMSPASKKRRQNNRLKWLQLISKVQKLQQMQKTFNFLGFVNIARHLKKYRTRLAILRWKRNLYLKYWNRLRSGIVHDNYMRKFTERGLRVREVRAKQAADYIAVQDIVEPQLDFLTKPNPSEAVQNLQGRYLNCLREQREKEDEEERRRRLEEEEEEEIIERDILPEPEVKPRFSRGWMITFTIGAILGLILGAVLFLRVNSKLINYIRKLRHQPPPEFKVEDCPFGNVTGPKQGVEIENNPEVEEQQEAK